METVTVGGMDFTRGRPKICVPLAFERDWSEPLKQVKAAPCDLVEWRADAFADYADAGRTLDVLRALRQALGDVPLIYTLRTKREGGEAAVAPEEYRMLLEAAALSGCCNFVDVEACWPETQGLIAATRGGGVGVIVSKHDFERTPEPDEITNMLETLRLCCGDICKLALMPRSRADVLALMAASVRFHEEHPDALLIAISMGALGSISRVEAGFFGSAVTFASAGRASAPGQPDAAALREILDRIEAISPL